MPTTVKSTRMRGDELLTFKVGTTDFVGDCTSAKLTWDDADSGTVTFADAAAGGAFQGTLAGSGVQSTDSASFWAWAWDNVGKLVPFIFAPHGNATPSADQPHFTGTVKIGKRPDLGGDAQIDGDDWTFDFEWKVQGDVTRKVTGS